jgi:hypothetical protein
MKNLGLKDTAAWRIVRQVVDHTWGDEELEDEAFLKICLLFVKNGGSWQNLMGGDMDSIKALEDSIDSFMKEKSRTDNPSKLKEFLNW